MDEGILFCPKCNKEVFKMGISPGTATDDEISEYVKQFEAEGKILLINPPPSGPYRCPKCGSELEVRKNNI
ncbi:MAG: hypothetical protein ACTSWN_10775 [Promethearchaeota archaeon]